MARDRGIAQGHKKRSRRVGEQVKVLNTLLRSIALGRLNQSFPQACATSRLGDSKRTQ